MPWTERQQALLQAMGLRVWAPRGVAALPAASAAAHEATPVADPPVVPLRDGAPAPLRAGASAPLRAGAPAPVARPSPVRPVTAPGAIASSVVASSAVAFGAAAPAAPRQRDGIDTLDWPALRQAVAACQACGLCESRTQTVFGVGNEQAHWMVVGEAPGEQEDRQGEPFVGAAGQLLGRMLAALHITRQAEGEAAQRVYIANTLKCRPARNRKPGAEEITQCEPFLARQIELLKPRIILAMGRLPVQALLRSDEPIGRLRGRVHRYQGVPLVVTYDPAYLLRNQPDKARAWEDLCLAADTVQAGMP